MRWPSRSPLTARLGRSPSPTRASGCRGTTSLRTWAQPTRCHSVGALSFRSRGAASSTLLPMLCPPPHTRARTHAHTAPPPPPRRCALEMTGAFAAVESTIARGGWERTHAPHRSTVCRQRQHPPRAPAGTIASSGSKRFVQQLADTAGDGASAASANVIGQFGVGFYSVFMVADHVTVYSRQHGAEAGHCWRSSGDGAYELSEASNVAGRLVRWGGAGEPRFPWGGWPVFRGPAGFG